MRPELLLLAGLVILTGGVFLAWRSWRNQQKTGLPGLQVAVVYSDSGAWEKVPEPLFSDRFGLTGKPDYVLQTREGYVPIELKPLRRAVQPYESDVMQLAAYCLLLEEAWDETPPYGLLRYQDKTFRVEWTTALKDALLATLDEMRELHELHRFPAYQDGPLPEPQHDMTVRCHNCGFHYLCWPE